MKASHWYIIVLGCFVIQGCGTSLKQLKTMAEDEIHGSKIKSTALPENDSRAFLMTAEDKTIADSIVRVLISGVEEVLISEEQFKKLDFSVYRDRLRDTTYLTNMYITSPSNGEVLSYTYDLNQDDELVYLFENEGKFKLQEINLIEGSTTRFLKNEFEKGNRVTGSFRMMDDNSVTLNVFNNSFFANKGFFHTKIKVQLKKVAPLQITSESIQDSVLMKTTQFQLLNDTIYTLIPKKQVKIYPQLNISQNHQVRIPIEIRPNPGKILGWGYWMGFNVADSLNMSDPLDNPLVNFAKQELLRLNSNLKLPVSKNKELQIQINNRSLDMRTTNYDENYAFYISDETVHKDPNKGDLFCVNQSKINPIKLTLYLVAIHTKEKQVETVLESYTKKTHVRLSLSPL